MSLVRAVELADHTCRRTDVAVLARSLVDRREEGPARGPGGHEFPDDVLMPRHQARGGPVGQPAFPGHRQSRAFEELVGDAAQGRADDDERARRVRR